jgi:hypothetical protein
MINTVDSSGSTCTVTPYANPQIKTQASGFPPLGGGTETISDTVWVADGEVHTSYTFSGGAVTLFYEPDKETGREAYSVDKIMGLTLDANGYITKTKTIAPTTTSGNEDTGWGTPQSVSFTPSDLGYPVWLPGKYWFDVTYTSVPGISGTSVTNLATNRGTLTHAGKSDSSESWFVGGYVLLENPVYAQGVDTEVSVKSVPFGETADVIDRIQFHPSRVYPESIDYTVTLHWTDKNKNSERDPDNQTFTA